MSEGAPKNKGGRPATGRTYPHKVFGYLDDETLRLLEILEAKRARGRAEVIRLGIEALAEKEGVK